MKVENVAENTVLIVEDDPDLCLIMRTIMAKTWHVQVVHNIQDAMNYIKTCHPSIVFLDNNLPDGLGLEFLPQLRKINQRGQIIMMTAQNARSIEQKALQAGADGFMEKPFSAGQIIGVMNKLSALKRTG